MEHQQPTAKLFESVSGGLYEQPQLIGSSALQDTVKPFPDYRQGLEDMPEPGIVNQYEAAIPQERAEQLFELPETLRANKQAKREADRHDDYMQQFMDPIERAAHEHAQESRDDLGTKTTDVSRRDAKDALASALWMDAKLSKIIHSYYEQTGSTDPIKVVDALRTNKQLRVAVGKHFLAKTAALVHEHILQIPDRVVRNKQKVPKGLAPVPHLSSTEYVALLCVAMLDGTFDAEQAKSEPIVGEGGEVTIGQHRATANMVLHNYKILEDGSSSPYWYGS